MSRRHGRFLYLDGQGREVWLCGRGACRTSYEGPAADWEEIPIPADWDVPPVKAVSR